MIAKVAGWSSAHPELNALLGQIGGLISVPFRRWKWRSECENVERDPFEVSELVDADEARERGDQAR